VVIGGGIAGCSVAYHLTKLGWRDVLLLGGAKSPAARPGTPPGS
jgi:glycine/D-amino acid oxidase-like deaminating enzyme